MEVTLFKNMKSPKNGRLVNIDFPKLIELFKEHKVSLSKSEIPLMFVGRLKNNSRAKPMQVESKGNAIVLDLDKGKSDSLERIQDALKGIQHWIYTTHSHDPSNDNNCMRVFIHTTDELNQTNYRDAYWNLINSNSGLKKLSDDGYLDHRAEQPTRGYLIPAAPQDKKMLARQVIGGGIPYKPNTQKADYPKSDSSSQTITTEGMIPMGQRNDALTVIAGRLVKQLKVKELVREQLMGINQLRCEIPLPNYDVDTILNSIWQSHKLNHPEDKIQEQRDAEPADEFADVEIIKPSLSTFQVEPPPRKFLFDGFIPEGIVGAMAAQGGVGKSFAALQMCSSAASGFMLYNKWTVGNRGIAVYISGEETRDEIERRLYYINRHLTPEYHQKMSDNIRIISFADKYFPFIAKDEKGNIIITETVEKLVRKLLMEIKEPISLIVVDPISRFRDGDENDNTAGTRFVQALQKIRTEINERCTLLAAAHVNKAAESSGANQNNLRGASSVVDGVRFVIELNHLSAKKQNDLFGTEPSEKDRYIDLKVTKSNYTPRLDPIYLKITNEGVPRLAENAGHHVTLEILKEIEHGSWSQSAFKEEFSGAKGKYGLAERPMREKLKDMINNGLVESQAYGSMSLTQKGLDVIKSASME